MSMYAFFSKRPYSLVLRSYRNKAEGQYTDSLQKQAINPTLPVTTNKTAFKYAHR